MTPSSALHEVPPRPVPLPLRADQIPAVLRSGRRFVVWNYGLNDKGDKWTKPLYIATDPQCMASSTDPKTWRTFDEALATCEDGKSDGLGIVLGRNQDACDRLAGVDLDHCLSDDSGEIADWAQAIIDRLNSYTEHSPSGHGVRIFVWADGLPPNGRKRGDIEMYVSGRYLTLTGHHIEGTPAEPQERHQALAAFHAEVFAPITKNSNSRDVAAVGPADTQQASALSDDELLVLARAARNKKKFSRLWGGDRSGYPSPSEADSALCCILAYWSAKDPAQMDRLFRCSDLWRPKWDESRGARTYGQNTIHEAIEKTSRVFSKYEPAADEALGRVVMRGGELPKIVDRAERTLLTGSTIYQRGGMLTRPIKLDTAIGEDNHVRREAGSTMLVSVREAWLLEQLARRLKWFRYNEATDQLAPADPYPIYARTLLSRGEWRFPVLRGVVTAPTLARDGRIISEPGFDVASGLLVDIAPGTFPPVPLAPTKADARKALEHLAIPLRKFPFVDDAAKAVALSALLTGLVRVSLRTAPLHGYDAPTAGTGKSLLAEMVGLLATGNRPPALSQGKSEEEDEKRLSTILFAGDPVIHIDNCERPISGDFLCSMLTQELLQARILGLSERRVLPSTALVLASGNNLTLAGDASRRSVICRLDAQMERPDTRAFDFDCHAEVLASRPELVVAGLTILRAYHLAGRPEKLTPMGSFTDWEWVRGALVWLGCADPADTRSAILDSDPRRDELTTVMNLWEEAFGESRIDVAEITTQADAQQEHPNVTVRALRDKFVEVACRGKWSGKSVGWWLRRNKDRVIGGRCFRCDQSGNRQQWWLAGAQATFEG
ncbi:MAG: hypothetical protein Q7J25_11340 [Vicinamibacterales bacterium]|nr:hypothetical protein [Vicinamibacterales bacterium]